MKKPDLTTILEKSQSARLIPIVKGEEEKLVSILLATFMAVKPFAKNVLAHCNAKVNKTSRIECFTEVDFQDGSRPDGVVQVRTGSAVWTALVEAKIKDNDIVLDQVERYGEVAKANSIDAVLTISNQFVPFPKHTPYKVTKRSLLKKPDFVHFSWVSLLTQASLLMSKDENINTDQSFILREMMRYMDHQNSGIKHFVRMDKEWGTLVKGIRDQHEFKKSAPEIEKTVANWHEETRNISLILSELTKSNITMIFPRKHRNDPEALFNDACDSLASSKELNCSFSIPNTASNLELIANLPHRTISCLMKIDSTKDFKTSSGRVNWIARQLKHIDAAQCVDVKIRAFWPNRKETTQATLSEIREDPDSLSVNMPKSIAPTKFEVFVTKDIGQHFLGPRKFIEAIEELVPEYYDLVGRHLKQWKPSPPEIEKKPIGEKAS